MRTYSLSTGPVCQAVHERREDHENSVHRKLRRFAWALHGLQVVSTPNNFKCSFCKISLFVLFSLVSAAEILYHCLFGLFRYDDDDDDDDDDVDSHNSFV